MRQIEFKKRLHWSEKILGKTKCWRWFPVEVDEHRQRMSINGRKLLGHRYAYELLRDRGQTLSGPLAKNQPLVQTCDSACCLNPHHHMPALSQKAVVERGEWTGIAPNDPRGAHNRQKETCPYGHAFTDENTGWTKDGKRRCLACHRERAWLPLDARHIIYPNEVVRTLTRSAAEPVAADFVEPEWDDHDETAEDPGDWAALEPATCDGGPDDDAGVMVEGP